MIWNGRHSPNGLRRILAIFSEHFLEESVILPASEPLPMSGKSSIYWVLVEGTAFFPLQKLKQHDTTFPDSFAARAWPYNLSSTNQSTCFWPLLRNQRPRRIFSDNRWRQCWQAHAGTRDCSGYIQCPRACHQQGKLWKQRSAVTLECYYTSHLKYCLNYVAPSLVL